MVDDSDIEAEDAEEAYRIARLYAQRKLEGLDLQMHEKAMAIGQASTVSTWAGISTQSSGLSSLQLYSKGSSQATAVENLQLQYKRVQVSDVYGQFWQAAKRICLARFYQAYTYALDTMAYTPPGQGQSSASQKKRELFKRMCATQAADATLREREFLTFDKHLRQAAVWFTLQEALGPGTICLFPEGQITDTWVTNTLSKRDLNVWVRLIRLENPDCIRDGEGLWPVIQQSMGIETYKSITTGV